MMNINEIKAILPHRYPFLLVDKVLELVEGEYIIAVRSVSNSELVFEGHFPNNPILPGVLIIEAMAQTAGLLAFKTINQTASSQKAYVVAAIEEAKFRRPVLPGDQLFIRAHIKSRKKMIWKFGAVCHLNSMEGDEVASATITCAERDLFN